VPCTKLGRLVQQVRSVELLKFTGGLNVILVTADCCIYESSPAASTRVV
jgi:hypothetical protein